MSSESRLFRCEVGDIGSWPPSVTDGDRETEVEDRIAPPLSGDGKHDRLVVEIVAALVGVMLTTRFIFVRRLVKLSSS